MGNKIVCLALANLVAFIWFSGFSEADAGSKAISEESVTQVQAETGAPEWSAGNSTINTQEKAATRGKRNQSGNQSRTIIKLPNKARPAEVKPQTKKRGKSSAGSSEMSSAQIGNSPHQTESPYPAEELSWQSDAQAAMERPIAAQEKMDRLVATDKNRKRAGNSRRTVIDLPKKQTPASTTRRSGKKAQTPASPEAIGSTASGSQAASGQSGAQMGPVNETRRSIQRTRKSTDKKTGATVKNRRGNQSDRARSTVTSVPASAGPAPLRPMPVLTAEEEMARAYQAFEQAYAGSLGKTRKELNALWGFPMKKLGDDGDHTAYGFRQKGLLDMPETDLSVGEPSGKKATTASYYAPKSVDPSLPGKYFTCLVVLWVDKNGRGVVVDGDAVGDCFMVETLSRQPEVFER